MAPGGGPRPGPVEGAVLLSFHHAVPFHLPLFGPIQVLDEGGVGLFPIYFSTSDRFETA